MKISFNGLKKFNFETNDNQTVPIEDILFDDASHTVRYICTKLGNWVNNERILVSPYLFHQFDIINNKIELKISFSSLENCPTIDDVQSVSREMERKFADNMALPYYWYGDMLWGIYRTPYEITNQELHRYQGSPSSIDINEDRIKNHLRSAEEIIGYQMVDQDSKKAGRVHDLILDVDTWEAKHIVVDIGSLLNKELVHLPITTMVGIHWRSRAVLTNKKEEYIQAASPYIPDTPVNQESAKIYYDFEGNEHHQVIAKN